MPYILAFFTIVQNVWHPALSDPTDQMHPRDVLTLITVLLFGKFEVHKVYDLQMKS